MPDSLDQLREALADRYRLERELGRGGMATVYLIRRAGSVPHLRKPFGDDELFDAMRRAMAAA